MFINIQLLFEDFEKKILFIFPMGRGCFMFKWNIEINCQLLGPNTFLVCIYNKIYCLNFKLIGCVCRIFIMAKVLNCSIEVNKFKI